MKTVTGILVVLSIIILSADGASARHYGSQKVVMLRGATHHFIYFNAEVTRHYPNEVIFAGRYLGADPDPGVRLNLRMDRPDGK
jgi:hypothetical protein